MGRLYFSKGKTRIILEPLKGRINALATAQASTSKAPLTEPKITHYSPMKKYHLQKENYYLNLNITKLIRQSLDYTPNKKP